LNNSKKLPSLGNSLPKNIGFSEIKKQGIRFLQQGGSLHFMTSKFQIHEAFVST
jgi:hypothetical protein